MTSAIWSGGRYEAVGERIASVARSVVDAVDKRRPLRDAAAVDLACGTGSAALLAAGLGAQVTAVDITADLIAQARHKGEALGHTVRWVIADASDTGLGDRDYDAVVSNMGIIFVEPVGQVAEIARLLKSDGVLGFSSWMRKDDVPNPFFDPIVAVLGPPPKRDFGPDQWGDRAVIAERLANDFEDIEISEDVYTWRFSSVGDAVHFMTDESPMHVDVFRRLDDGVRHQLVAAFHEALSAHVDDAGAVYFGSPYLVVTARRR